MRNNYFTLSNSLRFTWQEWIHYCKYLVRVQNESIEFFKRIFNLVVLQVGSLAVDPTSRNFITCHRRDLFTCYFPWYISLADSA